MFISLQGNRSKQSTNDRRGRILRELDRVGRALQRRRRRPMHSVDQGQDQLQGLQRREH